MTPGTPAPDGQTVEARLAEVLAAHQWHHTRETHCACGFRTPLAQLAVEGYVAHLAAALAPVVAAEVERAVGAALEAAAAALVAMADA